MSSLPPAWSHPDYERVFAQVQARAGLLTRAREIGDVMGFPRAWL